MDEIKSMNIYQKIHAVASDVGKVQMSLNVATKTDNKGNVLKSYKAVSINDVVDSLLPSLTQYRLVVLPAEKEIIEQKQITTTSSYGDRTSFFIRMKAEYIIVNIDNPSEQVKVTGYGDGIDTGDKAFGKADTYARKIALIDAFNLSRGDDPDVEASKEYKPMSREPAPVAQTNLAIEMSELTRKLLDVGVDVHDKNVSSYICNIANVQSIDGGKLLNDSEGMKRTIEAMKAVLKAKKNG